MRTQLILILLFIYLAICFGCGRKSFENLEPVISLDSLITIPNNLPNGSYRDAFFFSPDTGLVVGHNGIFKTMDGGSNWRKMSADLVDEIDFFDEMNGIAVGSSSGIGFILYTRDGGETWMYSKKKTSIRPSHISIVSTTMAYILGNSKLIYLTKDSGENWIELLGPDNAHITAVKFRNVNDGIVTGSGKFFSTRDGGLRWGEGGVHINDNISDINYIGDDIIFKGNTTITKISKIVKPEVAHLPAYVRDIHFFSTDTLIACGMQYPERGFFPDGTIYTSTNFWQKYSVKYLGPSTASEFSMMTHNGKDILFFGLNTNGANSNATILKLHLNGNLK